MPDEIVLVVRNRRYAGWKAVRVTRSIESLAGSFEVDVSDRWADQNEPLPIVEEDACRVEIVPDGAQLGTVVIDGFIGKRRQSADASTRTLTYSGRDRAGQLVDCSAIPDRWTFRNVTLLEFAQALADPFSVGVSVQPGLTLARQAKLVVQPGDTVYEAIARAARDAQVLLVSDARGGIVITRAGATRATSLTEGFNILAGYVEYDGDGRFRRYVVLTQVAGTDEASGTSTRIRAEAVDEMVRRESRVLVIRPENGMGVADARRRADWEARTRAALAEQVPIAVQGWTQPDRTLWPINALVRVRAPRMLGVDGDLLISQVEHTISDGGRVTQLRLVRPDAFTPEPKARVGSTDPWKNL
jgi:prophage tail gpP-like protein